MMTQETALKLILDRECANKLDIPLIESFKPFDRSLFKTDGFLLPPNSDFGNLTLTLFNIINRFDFVNSLIIELYRDFDILKRQRLEGNGFCDNFIANKQLFMTEQIIYWLRKTADELISMIYILKEFDKNKCYAEKIKIDSIGSFIYSDDLKDEIGEFRSFLETINNISNAYKHSLVNAQVCAYRGEEEPVVFAYHLPYNDRKESSKFYSVRFREVLENYKNFVDKCKLLLSTYSIQLQDNNSDS